MIGKTLAHYEILEKIGQGGMGEVYRARDTQLDRDVAIKILPEIFSQDPERLARFEREAKLLASLNHPGIAVVHGLHEQNGVRFLAMELVPGEDLAQRLGRGGVSLDDALEMAVQIAEALEAAHEQGVIHRDLKPANIVLSADGKTKILDFGLAKSVEGGISDSDLSQSPTLAAAGTMQGTILGTAAYMSPEQARGRPVDKRSDIWSFGVILYELLTGLQLFTGETASDTMAGVLKTEIDFDTLPGESPGAVVALLKRCLDRNPAMRLRDMGEARIILNRVRAGELTDESVVAAPSASFLRTHAGWIVAGGVVIAAVISMVMSPKPTSIPEAPLRKFTIPVSRSNPSFSSWFDPSISPDGRYLVYTSENQLWLRDLTSVDPRPLAGTEGAANSFWSPDGKWVAFGVGQSIQKISLTGGNPVHVANLTGSQNLTSGASSGSWTLDGKLIISTGVSGLLEVSAKGGEVTTLLDTREGETDFHQSALLPDGKGVLFVVHHSQGSGWIDVLTPDGTRKAVLRIDDGVGIPGYSPSGHIVFRRGGDSGGIWALPFSLDRLEATGDPFLVALGGGHPSVSMDGALVYLAGATDVRSRMVWMDRTGTVVDELGPAEPVARPFPNLSPDEKWIFHAAEFGDTREIFRYDVSTKNRQRITFNDLRIDLAILHPNGQDIIYYESNSYYSYLHSLTGSREPQQILRGIMTIVTRDGSRFVFSRNKPDTFDFDILVRDADGGEETEKVLVSTPGLDWYPQLSPDERFLVYTSDETGRDEVYVTTFPEANTRWQVSSEGGSWPRWRGDGKEILFATRRAIWAVDVNTESGLSLGVPRELFKRESIDWSTRWPDSFDVTDDGQRFVIFRPVVEEDAEQPAIVVVQNWYEEFRGEAGP